jgi:predicted ABC-type ATPase
MRQAKARGFTVVLVYVALKDAELNVQRVRERVAAGGHAVPAEDIRRRYERSLVNAAAATRIADSTVLFDNSREGCRKLAEVECGIVTWVAPELPDWARRVLSALGLARPAC